jgi:hypothetical protein
MYAIVFRKLMLAHGFSHPDDVAASFKQNLAGAQERIIAYLLDMQERGTSWATRHTTYSILKHFCEQADVLNIN